MRSTFLSSDGRIYGEPIFAVLVILVNALFEKNTVIEWFGWWLLVLGIMGVLSIAVASIFCFIYRDELVERNYPAIKERNKSHRTFILTLCYSIYLFFWWKWSILM